jgi:starch synthase
VNAPAHESPAPLCAAAAGLPLRVLFVTAECAPWVKTGGLGDVCAALPRALAGLGHDVRVLMPAYRALRRELPTGLREAAAIALPAGGPWPAARLVPVDSTGFELWLLDCPALYDRPGGPYVDETGHDHADNALRFGFLSHVAAHLCAPASPWADWRADVLHANDWPSGLAPAYLALMTAGTRRAASVFTIHNLAFQGLFPATLAPALGLPPEWLRVEGEGLLHWDQICMLKAGVRHADAITTVSPTYAREIQTEALGFGMEGMLRLRADSLHGILNGIDRSQWDPQTDKLIAQRYGAGDLDAKAANKQALQQRMGLPPERDVMLLGMVTRLTEQKGVDLVLDNVERIAEAGLQWVALGKGDTALEQRLRAAARAHPRSMAVELGFDEGLAHLIEAGADCFLMPSRFEPCGLNQMYSLAYGTPPLVHATGGLVDSVTDTTQHADGTGFVMREPTPGALWRALTAAQQLYRDRPAWRELQRRGMARRFGWEDSAQRYVDLYRSCLVSAETTCRPTTKA